MAKKTNYTTRISVRVRADQIYKLERMAAALNKSVGHVVRKAIDRFKRH